MIIATIQSTTTTTTKTDPRVRNLKRSIARKSTQNKNMQDDMDDALYQLNVDRAQLRVMKNKTNKTLNNANKTVQDMKFSVHGALER